MRPPGFLHCAVLAANLTGCAQGAVPPGTEGLAARREPASGARSPAPPMWTRSIVISPRAVTVLAGQSVQFAAQQQDSAGRTITGAEPSWMVTDPAVASVSHTGLLTAHDCCTAYLIVSAVGHSDTAAINVTPAPVASLSIAPAGRRAEVGEAFRVHPVPRGPSGDRLAIGRRQTVWRVADPRIATVRSDGTVTALAVGETTISATMEGVSASTNVIVTQYAREPAHFTRITERDFSDRNQDGWDPVEGRYAARLDIVVDSQAPKSGPLVFQMRYPAGFAGGSAPGTAQRSLGGHAHDLYLSMWIKLSANWQGHRTGTNKMFFLWINGQPRFFVSAEGVGSGPLLPQLRLQGSLPDPRPRLRANLAPRAQIARGKWQRWEFLLRMNTPGKANGEAHWWIDGTKVSEYRDLQFVSRSEPRVWGQFQWSPTWGGQQGTVTSEMSLRLDHFYASGSP